MSQRIEKIKNFVIFFVTVCQNKMQVDQEDQKLQAGDAADKKSEAEEMEVTCAGRCGSQYNVNKVLYTNIVQNHTHHLLIASQSKSQTACLSNVKSKSEHKHFTEVQLILVNIALL